MTELSFWFGGRVYTNQTKEIKGELQSITKEDILGTIYIVVPAKIDQ